MIETSYGPSDLCMPNLLHVLQPEAFLLCRYATMVCVVVVYLSVCIWLSVTLRYCIKTAKRRITRIMQHDSHLTLVSDAKNEIQMG